MTFAAASRTLRRAWFWLTAPDEAMEPFWCQARRASDGTAGEWLPLRSWTDAELVGYITHRRSYSPYVASERLCIFKREADRRGLTTDNAPLWVQTIANLWPDGQSMHIAERILRP